MFTTGYGLRIACFASKTCQLTLPGARFTSMAGGRSPSRQSLCHNCQNHTSSYFCHSGLDPESSVFSDCSDTGCRIKSGMTNINQTIFEITTRPLAGGDAPASPCSSGGRWGRGFESAVCRIIHPHPVPLPSRERELEDLIR